MTAGVAPVGAVAAVSPTGSVDASPTSVQRFGDVMAQATAREAQAAPASGLAQLIDPLLDLNGHSMKLAEAADLTGDGGMRPGALLELTMRSHEFLFHCELVSNVANRSSDGLQQLFRQQS